MSEKFPVNQKGETVPVLFKRGEQILVGAPTDIKDKEGRSYVEFSGGAKPITEEHLSADYQAALASELAETLDTTQELAEDGPRSLDRLEEVGEVTLDALGIDSPDDVSNGFSTEAETKQDVEAPKESAEAHENRIKRQTIDTMSSMLSGITEHAEVVGRSGDPYAKRGFNENMVSSMSGLKNRIDNELVTPEGAAMIAGLLIGATTDPEALHAVFRIFEQRGGLQDEDTADVRQVLHSLDMIAQNPHDVSLRHSVLANLNMRGDNLLATATDKRLGAVYTGIASGVAIGSGDYTVIGRQRDVAFDRLYQM